MNTIIYQTTCDRCDARGNQGSTATAARDLSIALLNFERIRMQYRLRGFNNPIEVGKFADLCKPCVRTVAEQFRKAASFQ